MRILLTGGSGFIGTNLSVHLLDRYPDYSIVNLSPRSSGIRQSCIAALQKKSNYKWVEGRVENEAVLEQAFELGVDLVINMAAQTHVDRSLETPGAFISANVMGTQRMLDMCINHRVNRFVQISSAEVYGPVPADRCVDESAAFAPVSPYASSKAACDLLTQSYHKTFGMETMITRCTNNYGPYQTMDKLVPLVIMNALQHKPIPLYGDGGQMRDWLHVADHCAAIDAVIHKGLPGSVYNIAGNQTATTKEIVEMVLQQLDLPWSLVHQLADRPGNFDRYSLCIEKLVADTGWEPIYRLEEGIQETADWYKYYHEELMQVNNTNELAILQ